MVLATRLIIAPDQGCGDAVPQSATADPAFGASMGRRLVPDAGAWGEGIADYLAHRVARVPLDLRAHVQRIVLYARAQDRGGAYAALVDLFLALADKGHALRRRMLGQVIGLLDPAQGRALHQALLSGLEITDALPVAAGSVLSRGVTGITKLVQRQNSGASQGQDPLDEARSCLEYGQVAEAQRLLEAALRQDPGREALHHELLDIYRHTRELGALRAMRRRLEGLSGALDLAWQETERGLQGRLGDE